jgi:putative Holliday junction resolvase
VRVLAVDLGSKRVGLAISDPTGTIAQPLTTVLAEPADGLVARLVEVARSNAAERFVVGLPLRLDGTHGPEATRARKVASLLRRVARVPVDLVDERLTTAAAERVLLSAGMKREGRKSRIDVVAATLILQSYLDGKRRGRD